MPATPATPDLYDTGDAISLVFSSDDVSVLSKAGLEVNPLGPTVETGVAHDFYGDAVATVTVSPEQCTPVYWPALSDGSDVDSSDPFVAGPSLENVDISAGVDATVANQILRIFPSARAASEHLKALVAALYSCATFEVDGQAGLFSYRASFAEEPTSDMLHMRIMETTGGDDGGPDVQISAESDIWVFIRANLMVLLEGCRAPTASRMWRV